MSPRGVREAFAAAACAVVLMASASPAETGGNSQHSFVMAANAVDLRFASDSVRADSTIPVLDTAPHSSRNIWGLDILLSNNGFGLGASYRREFTEDLSGFLNFSISESKDDREVERYDYFGNVYVPGKLSRFLVMPLMAGVQYRLFREDITETFRPYVNAGAGPTLIYASPFAEVISDASGLVQIQQVEFFKSLGKGQPHYTVGAFVGIGANFGSEKANTIGVNIRYYFTYLLGDGLPSLYDLTTGGVVGTKKDFGGFFITFNIGFTN